MVVFGVWEGIHSRSDTNRTGAKGLSFYYPRLLYCLDQMLAMMLVYGHIIFVITVSAKKIFAEKQNKTIFKFMLFLGDKI